MGIRTLPLRLLFIGLLFTLPQVQCTSSIMDRSLSDYLRLEEGKRWVYLRNGEDTIFRTVLGDTVIISDTAKVVDFGGQLYFYRVDQQRVDRWSEFVDYRGGEEVPLEERFSLFLEMPLVLGNRWEDLYEGEEEFLGDTFRYSHSVKGEVVSLGEIEVPVGSFQNVYGVRIEEIRHRVNPSGEASDTLIEILYLAPDVGLVMKSLLEGGETKEYVLVGY